MTITLLPHQELAIEAAIKAGLIHSVEELIDSAIAHLSTSPPAHDGTAQPADLIELFEPLRGLFLDGELDFSRNSSLGRVADLR